MEVSEARDVGAKTGVVIIVILIVVGLAYYEGIIKIDHDKIDQALQEVPVQIDDDFVGAVTDMVPENVTSGALMQEIPIRNESGFDIALIEMYVHEFTNDQREDAGLLKLHRIQAIDSIARDHSLDMSERGYFEHTTPEGLEPTDRADRAGYSCVKHYATHYTRGIAENLSLSYTYTHYITPGVKTSYIWMADEEAIAVDVVEGLMNSPPHRESILNGDYDKIGIGVVINSDEMVYATQNFC